MSFFEWCIMANEGAMQRYATAAPEKIERGETGDYYFNFSMPATPEDAAANNRTHNDYVVKMYRLDNEEIVTMLRNFVNREIDQGIIDSIVRGFPGGIKIYEISFSVNGSLRPKDSANPFATYTRLFGALKSLVDLENPQGIKFVGSTYSLAKMYDVFYREILRQLGYTKVETVYIKPELLNAVSSALTGFDDRLKRQQEKDRRSIEVSRYMKKGLPPPHLSGDQAWDGETEKI